jgi:hypothetical protein
MRAFAFGFAVLPVIALVACAKGGTELGGGGVASSSTPSSGGAAGSSSTSTGSGSTTSTSATGGAGGATTSSSSSSTTTSGDPCHWKNGVDPCSAGFYCQAQGCGDGVCAPVGTTETQNRSPVCGCDGVSYWNESVAAAHGMAVQGFGACAPAKTCGGVAGTICPTGAHCALHLASATDCGGADLPGTCWAVPKVCPNTGLGLQTRGCGASACAGECNLIAADSAWYDAACP